MEVGCQLHAPTPVLIGYEDEWVPYPVEYFHGGEKRKICAPARNQTPAIQPLATHYSERDILALSNIRIFITHACKFTSSTVDQGGN
jgi:hypothetical protein